MPYYELTCKNCGQTFDIKASISERSERRIACPNCASNDLETVYRQVNIVTRLNKDCDVCPSQSGNRQHSCSGGCCCGR